VLREKPGSHDVLDFRAVLLKVVRLDAIVARSERLGSLHESRVVRRREQHDRKISRRWTTAQNLEDFQTIKCRHLHIQQQELGHPCFPACVTAGGEQELQRLLAILDSHDPRFSHDSPQRVQREFDVLVRIVRDQYVDCLSHWTRRYAPVIEKRACEAQRSARTQKYSDQELSDIENGRRAAYFRAGSGTSWCAGL